MRIYSRFQSSFRSATPLIPSSFNFGFLKNKNISYLPTDQHSFSLLSVTEFFKKWQLSLPTKSCFVFLLRQEESVLLVLVAYTVPVLWLLFFFASYVSCLRLCLSTALCILLLEPLQGTRHSTTHFFPSMAFMVSVFFFFLQWRSRGNVFHLGT